MSSILVARALGPERLGHYAYALALVNLTGLVAALGAPLATRKYMAEYLGRGERGLAWAVLRATLRFQTGVALVITTVGLVWAITSRQGAFLIPAILSLVPALLRGIATAALLATEDARWTVRASMISTALHLSGVLVVLLLDLGLLGLTSVLLGSRMLDLVIRWRYVRRQVSLAKGVRPSLPSDARRRLVRFCWHATLLLVLEVLVWNRFELLFLEHFSTIESVAFFSISFGAAQAIVLASRVAASAAGMTLMAESGREPGRVAALAGEVAYFIALLSIPLAAFGVGLAKPVIELAYGVRFAPAAAVLAILAAFTPFRAVFFVGQHLLFAKDDQRPLIGASVLGAAIALVLALLLIPPHGAMGAGVAKGLTVAVTTIATWYLIHRRHGVRLPLARLVGLLAVGFVSAAAMRFVSSALSPWAALPAGAGLGIAMLAIGYRLIAAVDERTHARLLQLQGMIPRPIGPTYGFLISWLAPGVEARRG